MFAVNPIDSTLSPIRYVGAPGPSVPVRGTATVPTSSSYRTQRGHLVTMAGLVLAAAVVGFGVGYAANATTAVGSEAPRVTSGPVAGEFRLGPGLEEAPGIVIPLAGGPQATPMPGEFRLGPGLQEAPGVLVPLG